MRCDFEGCLLAVEYFYSTKCYCDQHKNEIPLKGRNKLDSTINDLSLLASSVGDKILLLKCSYAFYAIDDSEIEAKLFAMENDFDKCISELYSLKTSSDIYEIHHLLQEVSSESSNLENVIETYKTDSHLKYMRDTIKEQIKFLKDDAKEFKFAFLSDEEQKKEIVKEEVKQEVREQPKQQIEEKQNAYRDFLHLDTNLPHNHRDGLFNNGVAKSALFMILLLL